MKNEEKIISMLEQIIEKQEEHGQVLNEHSRVLNEHSRLLGEHSEKHDLHTTQFKEHSQMLSALVTGQNYLKAEIDQMKITNADEFGNLKEQISQISVNQDLLLKNTLGMK